MAAGRILSIAFSGIVLASLFDGGTVGLRAEWGPPDMIPQGEPYPYPAAPVPDAVPAPPPVILNIPGIAPGNGTATTTLPTKDELRALRDNQQQLPVPARPTAPPTATTTPRFPPGYTGNTFPAVPPVASSTAVRPAGISLSKAAAERLSLNLRLEAAYYKDGKLILSGVRSGEGSIDASLLLTALRAACEDDDPYFSLDPDDAAAWNAQGNKAADELWQRVKTDLGWGIRPSAAINGRDSFLIRTISARRDYPRIWNELSLRYPDLKARLIFRPEWLRNTRFGEILYKGDVLLKELAAGVPVLEPGPLRAAAIKGYVSAGSRSVIGTLRSSLAARQVADAPEWQSRRLWFDLAAPQDDPNLPSSIAMPFPATRTAIQSPQQVKFEGLLRSRGFFLEASVGPGKQLVSIDSEAVDVSRIFPRMFVRRTQNGKDITGSSPDLDDLSQALNKNIEQYVDSYRELQLLVQVFRAYVIALQVARNDGVCDRVRALPLLDAEKVSTPLPAYHPSELFLTAGTYEFSIPRQRQKLFANAMTVNGGVSIAARSFMMDHVRTIATALTKKLHQVAARPPDEPTWKTDNVQFVALSLDLPNPAPTASAARRQFAEALQPFNPIIENEPPAQTLPYQSVIENEPPAQRLPPAPGLPFAGRWDALAVVIGAVFLLIVFTNRGKKRTKWRH